ncbi:RhuM family protein [Asaia sp. BMEF1]|uniref:RhuM family protein n=1 Tax=Asaia sp. BMEF1 TaxID=3155932 RepID=UPI003F6793A1
MSGTIRDASQTELSWVHYESPECSLDFRLDDAGETVWATQAQIAQAFSVSESTVRGHLRNAYRDGEISPDSVERKFRLTASDGKAYEVTHYNLDGILSVGYRVSGAKATAFRRWATQVLRSFITQGYALNEARLREDPNALHELAAKVRALRADEKNVYGAVRDVFAFASSDYDKNSTIVRSFYAKLQDKFLFAVVGKTAAQIILERAHHLKPNMGMSSLGDRAPRATDIKVGKNYLKHRELYLLHLLCEQFLLFVESASLRGKRLTMADLSVKFDDLLRVQDQQVLTTYDSYFRGRADEHAKREFSAFRRRNSLPEQ